MTPAQQLIIFDLDGTLSPSKSNMSASMGGLLAELLTVKKVAVISGGSFAQFEKQFLPSLPQSAGCIDNLYLLPTSGTRLYVCQNSAGGWQELYAENLSPAEKKTITTSLTQALDNAQYEKPAMIYGKLIEDRGSQITFSALGQEAPGELKKTWDPDHRKRLRIVEELEKMADIREHFTIQIGGATSIDITRQGINKSYGVRKLSEYLTIGFNDMVFVGDALYEGGNDYPVTALGIECISVSGPEETAVEIQELINK